MRIKPFWALLGHVSLFQWVVSTLLAGVPLVLGLVEGLPLAHTFTLAFGVFAIALIAYPHAARIFFASEADPQIEDAPSQQKQTLADTQIDWVPFHKALRYLVYEAQWAHEQDEPKTEQEFNDIISGEFVERLARGEITSRGRQHGASQNSKRASEPIPADYWVTGFVRPFAEIVLTDDKRCAAANPEQKHSFIQIMVNENDVFRIWPQTNSLDRSPLAEFIDARRPLEEDGRSSAETSIKEKKTKSDDQAHELARRIAAAPKTSEFVFPTLVAILRAEIDRENGLKSAQAGKPPHSVSVLMRIANIHTKPMDNCMVQLFSIKKSGLESAQHQLFKFSGKTKFKTNPNQTNNFYFVKRDMTDPITPKPFVILLADREMPLHENSQYLLKLKLISPYPIPTIVEVEVRTGDGVEISCVIKRQYLEGYG